MAQLWRLEHVMPYKSGVPRDESVNVMHIVTDGLTPPTPGDFPIWATWFANLFNEDVTGMAHTLQSYLSSFIDTPNCRVDVTSVTSFDPAVATYVPIASFVHPMVPSGGESLPLENAITISLRGTTPVPGGGVAFPTQAARRRGRLYFGPLTVATVANESDERPIVKLEVLTDIALRMTAWLGEDLTAASDSASTPFGPVVWSRKGVGASVITNGYVNNEWDSQRRRGSDETHRENF
jgi:hypothetical protein